MGAHSCYHQASRLFIHNWFRSWLPEVTLPMYPTWPPRLNRLGAHAWRLPCRLSYIRRWTPESPRVLYTELKEIHGEINLTKMHRISVESLAQNFSPVNALCTHPLFPISFSATHFPSTAPFLWSSLHSILKRVRLPGTLFH